MEEKRTSEEVGELSNLIAKFKDHDALRIAIRQIPAAKRLEVISLGKYEGKTLMYHAVEKRCKEALQVLADFVCDPNIKNTEKGRTCLHLATELADEEMCKIIINGFGNVALNDEDGKVACDLHPTDPIGWGLKLDAMRNNFDQWMLKRMTRFINVEEAQNYRRTFDHFDTSGDGMIQIDEMRELLFSIMDEKPTETDLKKFYGWFDKDNDGMIVWTEFLCAIVKGFQKDQEMRKKKKKRRKGKKGKKKGSKNKE